MNSKYNWIYQDADLKPTTELVQAANGSDLIANLLLHRGIETPNEVNQFFHPDLRNLNDPNLFPDMPKAIERIQDAIINEEKIVIYGDYDADGVTSTSVMVEALRIIGAEPDFYIPDRFKDGYGPNIEVYKRLIADGAQLIITVDNGVSGFEAVEYAQQQNVDVIITDHHELPAQLPPAYAIIHPRVPGTDYPFKDLAGVGVAFKVACALLEEVPVDLLDFVALGTVGDLVSLRGENRILVSFGLEQLKQTGRSGLLAMYKNAKITPDSIDEVKIGFNIDPRLNSLGRLGDASDGVKLLTTDDPTEAKKLADLTEQQNAERQELVKAISNEALMIANDEQHRDSKTLIIVGKGWHEGVLGIVASHVVGATGKPTIILNQSDDEKTAKGSGRSVEGFNLFEALDPQRANLVSFGGHAMACGLTIASDKIDLIWQGMEQYADQSNFGAVTKPDILIDEKIQLGDITPDFYQNIQQLAPFGTDNPIPNFEVDIAKASNVTRIGKEKQHLKFKAGLVDVLGFGFGDESDEVQSQSNLSLVGQLSQNVWRNKVSLQIMLQDLASEEQQFLDWRMSAQNLNKSLLNKDASYVFFKPNLYQKMKPLIQTNSVFMNDDERIKGAEKIVVMDEPDSIEEFKNLLESADQAKMAFIFYHQYSPYLDGLPTRKQFGDVLVYLRHHRDIPKSALKELAQFLKIKMGQLILIIQVFLELDFVRIENGLINSTANPTARPLETAEAYQAYQQMMALEEQLVYSNFTDLKNWLKQML